jgi:hypothetical protein
MNKRTFRPVAEDVEDRLALSTLTVVNDTTRAVYVQLVRHHPATSGMLGDGTSLGPREPGYTEWIGYYKIQPGRAADFDPGDSRPDLRVSLAGGTKYYALSGSGIGRDGNRYAHPRSAYRLQRSDVSSNINVTINNYNYGLQTAVSLKSFGVTTQGGFYTVPNDETVTIHGPNKITGTQTFSFADYCGNLDEKSILHTFYTPHGTTITGYRTNITSNRGDNISFYKVGNSLAESGSISGGGLFSYGGSYVGTVQVTYAYP